MSELQPARKRANSSLSRRTGLSKTMSRRFNLKSTRKLGSGVSRQTRNLSYRASMVFSQISSRFLFSNVEEEQLRQARISHFSFNRGFPEEDKIIFEEKVCYVRVLKKSEERAVPRRLKFKGRVVVGDGRVYLNIRYLSSAAEDDVPQTVIWTFDVGLIKAIKYKRDTSKECYITFLNNTFAINILFKTPEIVHNFLQRIFFEARIMAQSFYKLMLKTINETWYKALKIGQFDTISQETLLSDYEKRNLIMSEEAMDLVELCLRNEVDYCRVSKGLVHEDLNEAFERLGLFLTYSARVDEGKFWINEANEGRKKFDDFMRGDMLGSMSNDLKAQKSRTAIDDLRNPPGLERQNLIVTNKNLMNQVNYEQRIWQIQNIFQHIQAGTYDSVDSDPFEQFIPQTMIELQPTVVPTRNEITQQDIANIV